MTSGNSNAMRATSSMLTIPGTVLLSRICPPLYALFDRKGQPTDFVFFSGHGSPGGFLFGVDIDDHRVKPTETLWGDRQLEWIALDACNVLERDGVFDRWGWPVFKGLHYILGFHTTTGDEPDRGHLLAEYLNAGWTVRQAWIRCCQDTEDSDTEWAYLRADGAGTDTYNDHWWGAGTTSADPFSPSTLFYGRGTC